MYYLLYDVALIGLLCLMSPWLLYQLVIKGRYREYFSERWGFLPIEISNWQDRDVIWIHAASVGETGAAASLVSKLRSKYPEAKLLFSTITDTGREMAEKKIEEVDQIIYFPLDLPWIVKHVLAQVNPDLIIMIETELWPNLLREAKEQGIKTMVASGRISDSSLRKYQYLGPLLENLLSQVDIFSMQSQWDVDHILELGAPPERVVNNGNLKFDQDYGGGDEDLKAKLYDRLLLTEKQPVLVMGSTHDDEEKRLLPLYQQLKKEFPQLVMILAPRYVKRSAEVAKLYQEAGIETVRWTELAKREELSESVIIIDTIGELATIYNVADLVFVGGSLIERGGHNILEPAACGKLVFFGPHMFNFKDDTKLLLQHEVGIQVADSQELTAKMANYLNHPTKLEAKSQAARQMIKQNQGASQRNLKLAVKLMESKGAKSCAEAKTVKSN
ncbi:MAG: 3-deoxy-D-manno-octulosonic acid transferase [Bacillota bacterium]